VRDLPAALDTHLTGDVTRLTHCWRVTRQDAQVFGFTAHDRDLIFDGTTFAAATGITPSATESQTKLAVDNLDAIGILDSDAITAEDIAAGIWDYAYVEVYLVDWGNAANTAEPIHAGRIGQVRTERGKYAAELRGLSDAYSQVLGAVYQPSCRATFCDARCGLDAGDYTVTGTLDDVSANGLVLFDAARVEPGPAGGKAITGITRATAPTVTCAAHGFVANQVIYVAGVIGMTEINGLTLKVLAVVNSNSFTIYGVDTTDFTIYASAGTATPQGDVGYFDYGVITMTSGASVGLSMEVKSYSPGVITLQLPLPFGCGAGNTYTLLAGCGKRFDEDCVARYDNAINFRGEPHVPGMDRLIWVGGQER
jgi:hypothetical protein